MADPCPRCDYHRTRAQRLHRRAQEAEAAARVTVDECRMQGVSLGRGLAICAAHYAEERSREVLAVLRVV